MGKSMSKEYPCPTYKTQGINSNTMKDYISENISKMPTRIYDESSKQWKIDNSNNCVIIFRCDRNHKFEVNL